MKTISTKGPTFSIPTYSIVELSQEEKHNYLESFESEKLDWGRELIKLPEIWRETEGEGINVAILDTGIIEHSEFENAVVKKQNFTSQGKNNDVEDIEGHGTFIAGIIGARRNNKGIVGIAPKCNLFIGKVAEKGNTSPAKNVIAGLKWCLKNKVDIVSISLSNPGYHPEIHKLIKGITQQGGFVICSGGNDREIRYPAKYPETLAIGSIDRFLISGGGATGCEIDFVAPGVKVLSINHYGNEATGSGTSFAAPFIAGITALILSKHKSNKYENLTKVDTVEELKAHLQKMSIDLGAIGLDAVYGYGLPKNWPFKRDNFIEKLEISDLTKSGCRKLIKHLKL